VAFEAALAGAGQSGSILCVKVRMAKSAIIAAGAIGSTVQIVVSLTGKDIVPFGIIAA
jgi:hypothetical protein